MAAHETTPTYQPALAGASGHNPALDGVRGMAILLVMWHHMTVFRAGNALETWYAQVAQLGQTGVDLFFVLSGFLITGILHDSKIALRDSARSYFASFYARRTLRIFPLYYAVLLLSLVALPYAAMLLQHAVGAAQAQVIQQKLDRFAAGSGYDLWFWLYLSNFAIAYTGSWLHGILGISWSLAIEEQFYLVWPLLIWFSSRGQALRICLWLAVLALACRCVLAAAMLGSGVGYGAPAADYPPWLSPIGVYVLTFCRIDALAMGAFAALALRSAEMARCTAFAKAVLVLALPAALASAWIDNTLGWANPHFGVLFGPLYQTLGYTCTGLACAAGMVLAAASRPGGPGMRSGATPACAGWESTPMPCTFFTCRSAPRSGTWHSVRRVKGDRDPGYRFLRCSVRSFPRSSCFTPWPLRLRLERRGYRGGCSSRRS